MDSKVWKAKFPMRLKNALEIKEVTQAKLAERMQVTEATISRYVNGSRTPKVTTLIDIANALDMPVSVFINIK